MTVYYRYDDASSIDGDAWVDELVSAVQIDDGSIFTNNRRY
jgi:hypothetical protein